MSLSKNDAEILEQIVQLEGKCMDSQRCPRCPFRGMCIPEFIYPNPPSQEQRRAMALNVLTHHALVDGRTAKSRGLQVGQKVTSDLFLRSKQDAAKIHLYMFMIKLMGDKIYKN